MLPLGPNRAWSPMRGRSWIKARNSVEWPWPSAGSGLSGPITKAALTAVRVPPYCGPSAPSAASSLSCSPAAESIIAAPAISAAAIP